MGPFGLAGSMRRSDSMPTMARCVCANAVWRVMWMSETARQTQREGHQEDEGEKEGGFKQNHQELEAESSSKHKIMPPSESYARRVGR